LLRGGVGRVLHVLIVIPTGLSPVLVGGRLPGSFGLLGQLWTRRPGVRDEQECQGDEWYAAMHEIPPSGSAAIFRNTRARASMLAAAILQQPHSRRGSVYYRRAGARGGILARGLFAGGVRIESPEADLETTAVMNQPGKRPIYEAAFNHDNIRVRVDILAPAGDGEWDLVEVKSSAGYKEEYLPDIGIQLHVLEGAGVPIRRACLVHVNNQYLYEGGDYDLERLFAVRDLTAQARDAIPKLLPQLEAMRSPLWSWEPPQISVGSHCKRPYLCPFYTHCHTDRPEYPLEHLPRMNQKLQRALREAAIDDIRDIPEDFEGLTDLHKRIRASVITGRVHSDPELRQKLRELRYPIHFLDFETCNPALPRFIGTHPFQPVPF